MTPCRSVIFKLRKPSPLLRRKDAGRISLWPSLFLVAFLLWPSDPFCAALTFTDEMGREVVLASPPKRILSLAPNITEILFELGLDEKIVGVSIHCNFPERAKAKVRVGSYIRLDYERILSLRPDLVVATGAGNTKEMVDRLVKLGFPVYVIYPRDLDGILRSVRHLGAVLNREEEAARIVREMEERKKRVVDRVQGLPRPRVFLQIGEAPVVTVGQGSFADPLIRLAGGENIAGSEKKMYPRYSLEQILKRMPEVILVSSMNPGGDFRKILQEWSRWSTLPAVQHGRVHLIDSDVIDRPAPRILNGLEEMARFFHPEKLKDSPPATRSAPLRKEGRGKESNPLS